MDVHVAIKGCQPIIADLIVTVLVLIINNLLVGDHGTLNPNNMAARDLHGKSQLKWLILRLGPSCVH